jgi:ornithine--oxo-acid transaminase
MITTAFRYDKVLFMNTGVEAGETAVKLARRWGYDKKHIPNDQAKIVFAKGNFWGRTTYACATSDDPSRYERFGPFDRSAHYLINYNDIKELEELLEKDPNICAVFLEPIQGENGVVIPDDGYLSKVSALCKRKNVLFIADEVQTGMGRTGFPSYCEVEGVKPDILLLGKSLAGGLYPVSAVLANKDIMDVIGPGEHGSTFGGNPLGVSITQAALSFMINNNLFQNAHYRGIEFGACLRELSNNPLVKEVRGRGLMYAIGLWPDCGLNAYDFSLWLMERGLLCKPTRINVLR